MKLEKLLTSINLVDELDEETLNKIAEQVCRDYETDDRSRSEWLDQLEEWEKLAGQIWEEKSYPWPNASNIKYPIVSVASIQFNARAFPTLIPNQGKIVKTTVYGKDPDGKKLARATKVADFMSWQLKYDIPDWDEGMDRLLMMLPVCGNVFKKIFFDPSSGKNCSYIIHPKNLVVNNGALSLESATRISELLPKISKRTIVERQRAGIYNEKFEFTDPDEDDDSEEQLYCPVEQHCFLDLDEDGYSEPYVVTFHPKSEQILRIVHRFKPNKVQVDDKGKIQRIEPEQFYVKYTFIPSFDNGFYDIGFGHLLGPINEATNTLINQLVDAGTLANLQAGFIGKGLRLKMGDSPLKPGEFRAVNAIGDDLRKQIVPLPFKEPSNVLFQLLGMLVQAGKELASVAEIFVGKMPGQNTPATTTMATIEQGMKVFTAIYRRVYRSLEKEFKRLYELNGIYLDPQTMVMVLDEPIGPEDFEMESYDICPAADPAASSQTERLMKAQALLELLPTGLLDPVKVVSRVLEAQDHQNWQELIPGLAETGQAQIPQQPDPKMLEMQMKAEAEQAKSAMKQQELESKMVMDQRSKEAELAMKAQDHAMDLQHKAVMNQLDTENKEHLQKIFMVQKAVELDAKKQEGDLKSKQQKQNSTSGKARK